MNKIIAHLSNNGNNILYFELKWEEGSEKLSTQDLMDFVDTDIPLYFNDKKMSVNDYLGESRCFAARQSGHSF